MPSLPIRRLVGGLLARYHVWSGRRAYRAGRLRTAGRHLDVALAHGHESFSAWLLLGKVAYRERDLGRAAECFRQARRADPVRFSLEGFPDNFVDSLKAKPDAAPRQHFRVVIEARQGRVTSPAPGPSRQRLPQVLGDFSSHAEWAAAKGRPALQPGEGADVDWDEEARKLFDD